MLKVECLIEEDQCVISCKHKDVRLEIDGLKPSEMSAWLRFLATNISRGRISLDKLNDLIKNSGMEKCTKQVSLCCTTFDSHSMLAALANSYGIESQDAQKKLQEIAKDLRLWLPDEGGSTQ